MNPELFNTIFNDLETLKGVMSNSILVGTVTSIDLESSKAEVRISQGKRIKASKWVSPNLGGGVIWSNLIEGQKVLVLCVSGNLNNAYILPYVVQDDEKPDNYNDSDIATLQFSDDVKIIRDGDKLTLEAGNSEIEMTNTGITMKNGLNSVTVDLVGVTLEATPNSKLLVTPAGIAMTSPAPVTINGQVVVVI